jgi:hypothetical protein
MVENKFKPEYFINDLKRIRSFKDNRVLIWYCNLYVEYYIKQIFYTYKKNFKFGYCSECKKTSEPGFLLKVEELSKIGYVDSDNTHDKLIKMIYQSRNSAGHELDFKEINIVKKIEEQLHVTKINDPYGLLSRLFKNISPWRTLEISAIVVVAKLYENFEKINNRDIEEKLIFKINRECTEILPTIIRKGDKYF